MTTATNSPHAVTRTAGSALRAGLLVGLIALAGNLLVYAVARLADVNLEVAQPNSDSSQVVGVAEVAGMTIGALVLGALLLVAVARWHPGAWRAVAWLGLALGLLTVPMPLSMEAETAVKVTLASMHVIAGVAWFVVLMARDRRV
jgi:hypothetical protein